MFVSEEDIVLENVEAIHYGLNDLKVVTEKDQDSQFDKKLKSVWSRKYEENLFEYRIEENEKRNIQGKFGFLAEINMNRAVLKRKAQIVTSINMPFNDEEFHFAKVNTNEILLQLMPGRWDKKEFNPEFEDYFHAILLNNCPLGPYSSLFVPCIEEGIPQILTLDTLRLTVEIALLSHNPSLRIGMNSLGAFASVNHLHFHLYYLEHRVYLEHAAVKQLAGNCYETIEYPAECFVFQVTKTEKVLSVVKSIMRVIDILEKLQLAYNLFITRGSSFQNCFEGNHVFNALRIYVWPRKPNFDIKRNEELNPAFCELSGHLFINDKSFFDKVEEDDISQILHDLCHESFGTARDNVIKHMFV